jgi:tripartite-type tricarboxylate transporter receptor subunit TctC
VLQLIRDGKLKALGVISNHRDPTAPDIPTVNEGKAVKGITADLWTGLVGPANLPAPVVSRLSAAMREILADPKFRESQLKSGSVSAEFEDPTAFSRYLMEEKTRLAPVLAKVEAQ